MQYKNILTKISNYTFHLGPTDNTTELAKSIGNIGLYRIHCIQEFLGLSTDAIAVYGPDLSPSRNKYRCESGFITGGIYWWSKSDIPFIPIGFNNNSCGFCVFVLKDLPNTQDLLENLKKLQDKAIKIDKYSLIFDFSNSNHFIAIYKINKSPSLQYDHQYIGILHCSVPELKSVSPFGFGLDYDSSPKLQKIAKKIESNIGDILFLYGENAQEYYELSKYSEIFSLKKREIICKELFPDSIILHNKIHLGFDGINKFLLGCYDISKESQDIYPMLFGPNKNAYLVKPIKISISLKKFPIIPLPHSGGYIYNWISSFDISYSVSNKKFWLVLKTTNNNTLYVNNITNLPYAYRDDKILSWCNSNGLCEIVATLNPMLCFRI